MFVVLFVGPAFSRIW